MTLDTQTDLKLRAGRVWLEPSEQWRPSAVSHVMTNGPSATKLQSIRGGRPICLNCDN